MLGVGYASLQYACTQHWRAAPAVAEDADRARLRWAQWMCIRRIKFKRMLDKRVKEWQLLPTLR
jgi:hypothetical protein